MKLLDNTLIFENQTCWMCEGKKEVERGITCPRYNRPVVKFPDRKCPNCGAKNRYSHNLVGKETVKCSNCDGVGIKMETEFDDLPPAIFNQLEITVVTPGNDKELPPKGTPVNAVAGCTDYGRMKGVLDSKGKEAVIAEVRGSYETSTHQALFFLENKKGRFCDKLVVLVHGGGWTCFSIFLKK